MTMIQAIDLSNNNYVTVSDRYEVTVLNQEPVRVGYAGVTRLDTLIENFISKYEAYEYKYVLNTDFSKDDALLTIKKRHRTSGVQMYGRYIDRYYGNKVRAVFFTVQDYYTNVSYNDFTFIRLSHLEDWFKGRPSGYIEDAMAEYIEYEILEQRKVK